MEQEIIDLNRSINLYEEKLRKIEQGIVLLTRNSAVSKYIELKRNDNVIDYHTFRGAKKMGDLALDALKKELDYLRINDTNTLFNLTEFGDSLEEAEAKIENNIESLRQYLYELDRKIDKNSKNQDVLDYLRLRENEDVKKYLILEERRS